MVKTSIREHLTDAVIIIAGCAIYALGLVIFLEPNNIAPGGVSGIALIINFIFPSASVGVLIIVLNIPLFLAGWKFEGKPFLFKSLFGTVISSIMIDLFTGIFTYTDDSLLAAIYGGLLIGVGLGLVFTRGQPPAEATLSVDY